MANTWIVPKKLKLNCGLTKYKLSLYSIKPPAPSTHIYVCLVQPNAEAILLDFPYLETELFKEYEWVGPDVDISSIMIAPDHGSWKLQEIVLQKEEEEPIYFPCYDIIGGRGNETALYLESQKQKINKKPIYDMEYSMLKNNVLVSMAEFTFIGSMITIAFTNIEKGYAFALGGSIGFLYIHLLEKGVDNVGKKGTVLLFNYMTRMGLMFAVSSAILLKYQHEINEDRHVFILGVLGFMMSRIAFMRTYLKTTKEDESCGTDK
jgi:hypothetical protein